MTQGGVAVVSGPVNGGKGQIFGSPIESLDESGFVTEEYFLEGTAVSYAGDQGLRSRARHLGTHVPLQDS